MQKNVLITGCSMGLGLALTNYYLEKDYKVYGISRNKPNITNINFHHISFDLSQTSKIKEKLTSFIEKISYLDTVFLNAGMLGEIKTLKDLSLDEIKEVYDLNVYANKELLDILATIKVDKIIAISSGASINGSKGWAAYSLSKAAINMLINLYAKEMIDTKLLAIAPGVIETHMTDYIRFEVDDTIFTSAQKLKEGIIQTPTQAAKRLVETIERSNEFESGSFLDVRKI